VLVLFRPHSHRIVMTRENGVVALEVSRLEGPKVGAKRVAVKAQDVVRVHSSDGLGEAVVECEKAVGAWSLVGGLVEEVVACDPWISVGSAVRHDTEIIEADVSGWLVIAIKESCTALTAATTAAASAVATARTVYAQPRRIDTPHSPLVSRSDGFPDPDRPILELLELPQQRARHVVVAVPIKILSAGRGVEVDNSVDTRCGVLHSLS
jgi:hypothetical protein